MRAALAGWGQTDDDANNQGFNYGAIRFEKPPTLATVTKAALVKFKEDFEVSKEKFLDAYKFDLPMQKV